MLTFFPTPYEDELWYGIITRYHIRSGNTCWKYTIRELFPETKGYPRLGDTMPNTTMQIIAAQLPENVLSPQDCALQHSLFPFRMRFQPLEKKKEYLQEFLDGENMQPKFLFTTKKNAAEIPLRFCPQCMADDKKRYSEPYWHTEHQIASLPLCPKHQCQLVPLPKHNTMSIGQQLILPPENPPDTVFAATETEYLLTEALHYMYTLPYETSPNLLSENLSTAIENAGFLEDGNIMRQSWDVQRLYTALTERFGTDIVVRCFGKHITKAHARRLRRYEIYSTEEYAILAVLLDIPPLAFFSGVALPLELDMKMRELAYQGQVYTKARAAQLLGIREDQLLPYAKRFGIRPFWVQSGKPCADDKRQSYSVEIRLSAQEKEELDAYMAAHNMDMYGHALRYFMQKILVTGKTVTQMKGVLAMKTETKEKVAFMAASLFDLAEMTESDLPSVVEVVGTDAIQELIGMDHLRYECSYDRMAEEICSYIDWDPMLVMTGWTDEDLSRIGHLIADLVEGDSPADDDAAESLAAILTWDGLGAWVACNDGEVPICESGE